MVTLYVLVGKTGKRYVGITRHLPNRLREHAIGKTKAGQLLGSFALIHTEMFPDYPSARQREVFLKSGQGRRWLADNTPTFHGVT